MKELPASHLGLKAPSAMSNTPTPSGASLPTFHCKTGTENSLRQTDRRSVCRRKPRLGSRARVLCVACAPKRQADLADHRRNLCADLQAAAKAAHRNRDAEILRLVIRRRRQIGG